MGPTADPPTDERTIKATAYCWSSCSHMSATMPRVTDPPAEERPPRARQTIMVAKLGARAHGICQTAYCKMSREVTERREKPTVNEKERKLQHRPPPKLLTPRRPQLTPKRITNQKHPLPHACRRLRYTKVVRQQGHGVGVERGVEVHGDLDGEDDGEDGPFFVPGPREAEFGVDVLFGEFYAAVCAL